jgi:hypothetical protein
VKAEEVVIGFTIVLPTVIGLTAAWNMYGISMEHLWNIYGIS